MHWRSSVAMCFLLVGTAQAQDRPGPGDTLRFLQTVKTVGEMEMPTGTQQLTADMRLVFALAFLRPDSGLVWLDSATMNTEPPTPVQQTVDQMRASMRTSLRFLPDGSVRLADTAAGGIRMPGGMQITGSQLPFVLPHRGALRLRQSWTDTTSVKQDTMGLHMEMTSITRYDVVADSALEGQPVVVLATSTTTTTSSSGIAGGTTIEMTGKGEGSGRAYFSRALGLIVLHTASVQMETTTNFGTMSVQARNRADQSMRLVRR